MLATPSESAAVQERASKYHRSASEQNSTSVDRMMAWLLGSEWIGIAMLAFFRGAYVWEGTVRHWNPHFLAALLSGPAFIFPCIALCLRYPARQLTRHTVAAGQMLTSTLLIGITDGRIETHFHVFGSLAFLAFYRDWRVLVTASMVAALDHVARGIWWPSSIYGIVTVDPFRWLEHVWWVAFEDLFLFTAIHKSVAESKNLAHGKSLLYEGAYHDVLTGVANRRLLVALFDQSLQEDAETPKAILFVDLDRFKQANDLHGHLVGDKLLVEVAGRLARCLSPEMVLARVGGDEFVVFLNQSTEANAAHVGLLLLESLADAFVIESNDLLISATVGVSLYPEHGTTLAQLQECADKAMYSAKAAGRNQVAVFCQADSLRKLKLEDLARDLYGGMENKQFHLNYQPLIDRTGNVTGFEALIRWMHPTHGLISPAEFIPLAERSGSIVPIGYWVLAEACSECRSWQKNGAKPLGVAVNVSAVQFEEASFPSRVKQILGNTCLDPRLLTLELTESVMVRDVTKTLEHLRELRSLGVNISIDDFGTGFSSLSYLSNLPADSIKLDRSFVQREFGKSTSILESIIEMAHRLGLRVIAEGVEKKIEADWLLNLKCDELQGYRFSRPLSAARVPEYLASGLNEPAVTLIRNEEYEYAASA